MSFKTSFNKSLTKISIFALIIQLFVGVMPAYAADSGFLSPTAGSSNGWSNIDKAEKSDDVYASVANNNKSVNYAIFKIPSITDGSTIEGIQVNVEGQTTGRNASVSLSWDDGDSNHFTMEKSVGFNNGAADSVKTLGGSSDKWGRTWLVSDFTDSNFLVRLKSNNTDGTFKLDQLTVKVFYTEPDTTAPVITLNGINPAEVNVGGTYTDAGATAIDAVDGSFAATASGTVNTSVLGDYTITYNAVDKAGNHAASVTRTVKVVPIEITVTADPQTKVYGETDPTLGYQVTGSLLAGDEFSGALARADGQAVGDYAINQGTLALNDNYNITFVSNNLTIAKAPLSITVDDSTKVYGEANPTFTGKVSGVIGDDDIDVTYSSIADNTSPVGEYGITATVEGLALNNYEEPTITDGKLTVTAKPINVYIDALTKIYGTEDPEYTAQIDDGALIGTDELVGTIERIAGENVGEYEISGILTNLNYIVTVITNNLTITKAPITVTADNKTKVAGTTDPTLTYAVTSGALVGDDDFIGSIARAVGELAGQYQINQGTLSLGDNYDLSFIPAILTITSAPAATTTTTTTGSVLGAQTTATTTGDNGSVLGTETTTGEEAETKAVTLNADDSDTDTAKNDDKTESNFFLEKFWGIYNWAWILIALIAAAFAWWLIVLRVRNDQN